MRVPDARPVEHRVTVRLLYFNGVGWVVDLALNLTDRYESVGELILCGMKVPCLSEGVRWFYEYPKHTYIAAGFVPTLNGRFFRAAAAARQLLLSRCVSSVASESIWPRAVPPLIERHAPYVHLGLMPCDGALGKIPVIGRCVHGVKTAHVKVGGSAAIVEGDNPIFIHTL